MVLNLTEAQYVAEYILKGGDKKEFLNKFAGAYSEGFDPEEDLQRVGVANQTTMLKSETEQIGKLFEQTMLKKYGPVELNEHFMSFNTICDATQERQDAMLSLVEEDLSLMLVIGGFNSSNTTHLQEIAIEKGFVSYHIDSAERIKSDNTIEHKPLEKPVTTQDNWLPKGKIIVGVTSGASTPDKVVADAIERIFSLKSQVAAV